MTVAPRMWSIGGLDPSGGAGLTRDCLTAEQLGVHTCPIATMLTAQGSITDANETLENVSPVSITTFKQQLACLQATPPAAIKIGAIANNEQVDVLIDVLMSLRATNPTIKVVLDPVFKSTSGLKLTTCSQQAIISLLPFVDVITPNVDELSWLAAHPISSLSEAKHAALKLINTGVHAVVIKGGHAHWDMQATDWLIWAERQISYASPRHEKINVRGTGCRFASALSAALAHRHILEDAVCLAKKLLSCAFCELAPSQHSTNSLPVVGPANHFSAHPFPRLTDDKIGLYPVVDSVEWVKQILNTGINVLQLRIKDRPPNLLAQIKEAVDFAKGTGCQLFINDHWQEAIEAGAYGVHLGQGDLASADLTAIAKAGLRLGISTHGYYELASALQLQPSYIALGHIFPTSTKVMSSVPQGIVRLANYVECCDGIPAVAIGGINADNLASVVRTGVSGVAVVSAILKAREPLLAARQLQSMVLQEQEKC